MKHTIDDVIIIGAEEEGIIQSWIDASYGVYIDVREKTGGEISMGRGSLINKSIKKKFNTKNSTETEVIGVSDIVPYVLWLANFVKMQGYDIKDNILYQDNQSAMKMEKWKNVVYGEFETCEHYIFL